MDEVTPEMRLARRIAAQALRDRKMPSPSYEAIDVAAGKYDEHSAVQAALAAIKETREAQCPQPSGDEISHEFADDLGRIAYQTYCGMGPFEDDCEPDWGRTGYKAESAVWQAIGRNVARAALAARDREPVAQPTRSASDE